MVKDPKAKSKKQLWLFFFAGGVLIVLVARLLSTPIAELPPSESGYYSGPMMNKSRTAVIDENGKVHSHISPPKIAQPFTRPQ